MVTLSCLSCVSSFPHPQTPFFDFQDFPVPAVTPTHHQPAPQFKSYEPVYHKPEPAYHKPEPVYHKPVPVYHKPEPVYHKPEPVYHKPEPVYQKPAPIYTKAAPLYNSAGPPYNQPQPYAPKIPKVYATHPPAYGKPAPLPAFVNLGPGQYQHEYGVTEAPDEEAVSEEEEEIVEEEEEQKEPYEPSYMSTIAPAQEIAAIGEDAGALVDDVTDDVEEAEEISEVDKSSAENAKPEKLVIELPTTKPMMMEKTTKRVPVMMKTKGNASVKRVPVIMRTRPKTTSLTSTTAAPLKLTMTKDQLDVLVDMAVERLQEMEEHMEEMKELEEDGLVVLEPQAGGDIISVDSEADLDGMNIVDFGRKRI